MNLETLSDLGIALLNIKSPLMPRDGPLKPSEALWHLERANVDLERALSNLERLSRTWRGSS